MKQTNSLKRLNAVMQDINGDNTQILRWKSNVWRNGFSRHFPGKND